MRSTVAASIDKDFEEQAVNQNDANRSLFQAINAGNVDAMRAALDAGADPNAEDGLGETRLMVAARHRDAEMVRLLLDRGADVNARNIGGSTALTYAAGGPDAEMVRLLLDAGADVNARGCEGGTALLAATRACSPSLMRLLLDRGADVNSANCFGETPLICAVWRDLDAVRLLLDRGADVYARHQNGDTAVDLANPEVAALLRATQEARDLAAALPPAHCEHQRDVTDDFGVPDPRPARTNRPRL
jgi:ankyrin repeat protein